MFHTVVDAVMIPGVSVRIGEGGHRTALVPGTVGYAGQLPEGDRDGHFAGGLEKGIGSVIIGSNCHLLAIEVGDDDRIYGITIIRSGRNRHLISFFGVLRADGDRTMLRLHNGGWIGSRRGTAATAGLIIVIIVVLYLLAKILTKMILKPILEIDLEHLSEDSLYGELHHLLS